AAGPRRAANPFCGGDAMNLLEAYNLVIDDLERAAAAVLEMAQQATNEARAVHERFFPAIEFEGLGWFPGDGIPDELADAEDKAQRLWQQVETAEMVNRVLRNFRNALAEAGGVSQPVHVEDEDETDL